MTDNKNFSTDSHDDHDQQSSLPGTSKEWQTDTSFLRQGRHWSSTLIWISATLFTSAFVWGLVGRVDQTVTVKGRLVPAGSVREVDIPVTGVVSEVLVDEGQSVSAGQTLLRIGSVDLISRRSALMFSIAVFEAQKKYLSTMLKNQSSNNIIFELPSAGQSNVSAKFASQISIARKEAEQFNSRFRQIQLQELSLKKTLSLDKSIVLNLKPLYEEGGIGGINFLNQQNKIQQSESALASLGQEREKLIGEVASRITNLNRQLQSAKAEIDSLDLALSYRTLTAPISGTVFDLKATPSSLVGADQILLKIVPSKRLQANVEIPNSDIGFIKVGMPVDVSVDSFPSGEFGYIDGKLDSIGADSLSPDQRSPSFRFPATVQLNQQSVFSGEKSLNLQSGMSVTANIKVRSRPVISLITDLFTRQVEGIKRYR